MKDTTDSKLSCNAAVELLDRMANDPRLLVAFQRKGQSFLDDCGLPASAQAFIDGSAQVRPAPFVTPVPWISAPIISARYIAAPFIGVPIIAAPLVATTNVSAATV